MPAARSAAFVPLILCVALNGLPSQSRAQPKASIPDAPALERAKKTAGEIYGGRFRQAKTSAEKTALAAEMIESALKVQAGSPDRYVVLKIAGDIAAAAGDAPTALQAVEKLVEQFEVAGPKLKAETLLAAARSATSTSQHKAIGEAALRIVDAVVEDAADAVEYELALALCEAARSSALKTRLFALSKELSAKIEDLETRQSAFQKFRDAWAVLDADPTNPAANLAAARYLCFVQGDWDRGVMMLALGSDAELKAAAVKELRGATSTEEQVAIGDAWWDLGQGRDGAERDTVLIHAASWYRQAEPKLAGLAGLKVKQRLEEFASIGLSSRADETAQAGTAADADPPLFRIQKFSWQSGDPPTRLIPIKDGLCFLSMLTGYFSERSEAVEVIAGPDGWWYLNGKSPRWFRVEVIAVGSDSIKLSPTRAVPWNAGSGVIRLINGREGFCYLSAISGGFRGAGEAVRIGLEPDGWWHVSGKSIVPFDAIVGIVPWPARRDRPEVTSHTWHIGDPPVKMIHKNAGFCILSGIGGIFQGSSEKVGIAIGADDFWYLSGSSARASTFAEAIAVRFRK